jgi:hypothetical protein
VNDNALEITEQEQICCPGPLSVEQQMKRSGLSSLKLFSRPKDINKQSQEQLGKSEVTVFSDSIRVHLQIKRLCYRKERNLRIIL